MKIYNNKWKYSQSRNFYNCSVADVKITLFIMLFLMAILPRTYAIGQNSFLLFIFNIIEWPIYILLFLIGIYHIEQKISNMLLLFFICLIFSITWLKSGYAEPLKGTLLVFSMRDINYKKIINVLYYTLIFSIYLTLFLFILGISDAGVQRRGATAMGYNQANSVGFVLMFLTCLSLLRKDKISGWQRIILFIINIIGFWLSDSRTGFLLACIAIVSMSRLTYIFISKHISIIYVLSFLPFICCTLTILTAITYPLSRFSQMLNKLFTSRIWLNYYNLSHYKIPLFGQSIDLWNMTDSFYNKVTGIWSNYMTVDNVYLMLLLRMGVLSTLLIFFAFQRLICRMFLEKNYATIIMLSILCLYGLTESGILSIYLFFPFLNLFSQHEKNTYSLYTNIYKNYG